MKRKENPQKAYPRIQEAMIKQHVLIKCETPQIYPVFLPLPFPSAKIQKSTKSNFEESIALRSVNLN
jgi:hypothetical protein